MTPRRRREILGTVAVVAAVANGIDAGKATRVHDAVTVLTPWIAPTDTYCLELHVREDGVDRDETRCDRLPAEVEAGDALVLHLPLDRNDFDPRSYGAAEGTPVFPLQITAQPRVVAITRRALALAGAAGWLAFSVLFLGRCVVPWLRTGVTHGRSVVALGIWGLLVPSGLLLNAALAVLPIAAAIGVGGTPWLVIASLALTALAIHGARWLAGPARSTVLAGSVAITRPETSGDYREPVAPAPRFDPDVLARALRAAGYDVEATSDELVVTPSLLRRGADARVELRPAGDARFELRFNDTELLGRIVERLAAPERALDLELEHGGRVHAYRITSSADAQAFVGAFRRAQVA